MNDITRQIVTNTARKYKRLAGENGHDFYLKVQEAYHIYLMGEIGYRRKERALRLFHIFRPDVFDQAGYLMDCTRRGYEIDVCISRIAIDSMYRLAPPLDDYGNLPVKIAKPQMTMF